MSGNPPSAGPDPSMDDILASIRKILNEDEPAATTQPAQPAAPPVEEPIQLTPEMMIAPPESLAGPAPVAPREPTNIMQTLQAALPAPPEPTPMPPEPPAASAALVDPMAAAAAVAALGQLTRAVAQERTATITRGGPSIEDVVREELRPMLKAWLDAHLPATVERMVRAEIERVMARQG
jgi:cell pole-organizing protein PopZ